MHCDCINPENYVRKVKDPSNNLLNKQTIQKWGSNKTKFKRRGKPEERLGDPTARNPGWEYVRITPGVGRAPAGITCLSSPHTQNRVRLERKITQVQMRELWGPFNLSSHLIMILPPAGQDAPVNMLLTQPPPLLPLKVRNVLVWLTLNYFFLVFQRFSRSWWSRVNYNLKILPNKYRSYSYNSVTGRGHGQAWERSSLLLAGALAYRVALSSLLVPSFIPATIWSSLDHLSP